MTEDQTHAEEPEKRHGGLTEIMQLDVARNRAFITHRAEQLKTRHGILHDIEKRFLVSLIDAERRYEEELRELFPDL